MKSQLSPVTVQVIDWLGFTLNLREGCFSVPQLKIDQLKSAIAHGDHHYLDRFIFGFIQFDHLYLDDMMYG